MSEEWLGRILWGGVAWLAWLTLMHFKDRKEAHERIYEVESSVTKLEGRDTVGYRELMATFNEQISPVRDELQDLTHLVHAIAIKEGIEPDRRKK